MVDHRVGSKTVLPVLIPGASTLSMITLHKLLESVYGSVSSSAKWVQDLYLPPELMRFQGGDACRVPHVVNVPPLYDVWPLSLRAEIHRADYGYSCVLKNFTFTNASG